MRPNLSEKDDIVLTRPQASALLSQWRGSTVDCSDIAPLQGGICSAVFRLGFDRAPHWAVVKLRPAAEDDPLPRERVRLDYLREHTSVPCPKVYLQDDSLSIVPYSFLLVEHLPGVNLESARLGPGQRATVERELARVLAELHSRTRDTFGNLGTESGTREWVDVFIPRLQDIRGEMDELLPSSLREELDRALPLAEDALRAQGVPALIHHDVSPGNIIVENRSGSWHLSGLVDPVGLQYADAELELAYLEAWTVGKCFFDAYRRERPLRPGYEFRRLFYWLHTYMVHVWLGIGGDLHDRILSTTRQVMNLASKG